MGAAKAAPSKRNNRERRITMVRKLLLVSIALLVAAVSPSLAKDMTGKVSLGFHNSDAPVGGRYWFTDKAALDLGIGFKSDQVLIPDTSAGGAKKESTANFWFEAGVPFKLYDVENAHFFARPSVVFGLLDDRDYGTGAADAKWTSIDLVLSLGGELFFGDHFSVEATHGLKFNMTSVPDEVKEGVGTDSLKSFETFGKNLTTVGFHFYF
jgi:hypothetical protein